MEYKYYSAKFMYAFYMHQTRLTEENEGRRELEDGGLLEEAVAEPQQEVATEVSSERLWETSCQPQQELEAKIGPCTLWDRKK